METVTLKPGQVGRISVIDIRVQMGRYPRYMNLDILRVEHQRERDTEVAST